MELVHERVQERVRRHLGVRDARALARAVLLEVLPLDEERRTELRVNLALVVESPAHPRLAELAGAAQTALAQMCRDLCGHLGSAGLLHPSRDVALEGARLHALLDGTALHLLLDPAAVPSAEQLVEAHLRELATPSPEAGPASGAARR
nr:TetR family transcriptional regulator C-terminal domain-containing protein [Auraticoccus cholistanensis]